MEVPPQVAAALDDAPVIETVGLGAEDTLYLTSAETLHYRGEGILSDAGVDRYPHDDVTRVSVSTGRRKATIDLTYAVGDDRKLTVPQHALQNVLEPLLAGILANTGVVGPEETVTAVYRFSELTLVLTSEQLLKHVGSAVWDPDYETIAWGDVTRLDVEEGDVAAQLVVETTDRSQRTKIPRDDAVAVHRDVEATLCGYHGVRDYAEFEALVADADDGTASDSRTEPDEDDLTAVGLEPLGSGTPNRSDDGPSTTEVDPLGSGGSTASETPEPTSDTRSTEGPTRAEIAARLEDLERALARHAELLEEQRQTLADLREELTPDR